MPSDPLQNIEKGQFDNAPVETNNSTLPDPRQGGHFIDEDNLLEWSEPEDSAGEDEDEVEEYDGDDDNRAEDEDWEIAEGGTLIFYYFFPLVVETH